MAVPKDLDVFYVPHRHIKLLLRDVEELLTKSDFRSYDDYVNLLRDLSGRFDVFQCHEEIENRYILETLLTRVSESVKLTIETNRCISHSCSRLSDVMTLVKCPPDKSDDWSLLGEQLKQVIIDFIIDFVPHMNEEEEVLLPLLLENFTEDELKELTFTVMDLHNLNETKNEKCSEYIGHVGFTSLPPEILIKILSYLGPVDLCRLSCVNLFFLELSFDGALWHSLHPIRWARGQWKFFTPLNRLLIDTIVEVDDHGDLPDVVDSNDGWNQKTRMEREDKIMEGLINYVLPKVGRFVKTLDLSYGISVTSELACEVLKFCSNVILLDLSHTAITDDAFKNFYDGERHRLEYLRLSGCYMITDATLSHYAKSCSSFAPFVNSCGMRKKSNQIQHRGAAVLLKCLILAGCHQITDEGLRTLALHADLPFLKYLELSGLPRISALGLNELVIACPQLEGKGLFYCSNLENGPHSLEANGCQDMSGGNCCCNIYQT